MYFHYYYATAICGIRFLSKKFLKLFCGIALYLIAKHSHVLFVFFWRDGGDDADIAIFEIWKQCS